jgi:hypothetical protein
MAPEDPIAEGGNEKAGSARIAVDADAQSYGIAPVPTLDLFCMTFEP